MAMYREIWEIAKAVPNGPGKNLILGHLWKGEITSSDKGL